ncbi:MAG: HEAT repeat domain-containing protein [Silvibacterium sp.]
MLVNHAAWLIEIILCSCVATSLTAQNGGISSSGRGKSPAEELQSYGIELSQSSLLAALRNLNPRVRMLAAHQLQSDHDTDAIPAIESALSVEKDPRAGVGIATALSAMHDPKGTEHLQAMCADTTQPIRVVFDATQMLQLLDAPSGGCADAVLGSLNRTSDRDYRDVILSLLPAIYPEVSHEQAVRILQAIENLLRDTTQQASVRLAAGQALAQIGVPSSVEVVREAMSRENDPVIRASLQSDLNMLEKKSQ